MLRACVGIPGIAAVFLLIVGSLSLPEAHAQESYTIGLGEKLNLRVGRWRAPEGTYEGWADLSGQYTVARDGTLSVPIIGQVHAAGLTTGMLGELLATGLKSWTGISDDLSVAVEILEYRQIYVSGAVKAPGAYAFSPGLTVEQAIGLAGGPLRFAGIGAGSGKDVVNALGVLEVSRLSLWRKMVRIARLEAELRDEDRISLPAALKGVPGMTDIVADEERLLRERRSSLENGLAQLSALETLLEQTIASLDQQTELRTEQVEMARRELGSAEGLMKKGLTVSSRLSELARTVAEMQSNVLELQTARLSAEQRLNEVGREALELTGRFRREALAELNELHAEVDEISARMETAHALLADASGISAALPGAEDDPQPTYWITRHTHGGSVTEQVDGSARVHPADLIEIRPSGMATTPLPGGLAGPLPGVPAPDAGRKPSATSGSTAAQRNASALRAAAAGLIE